MRPRLVALYVIEVIGRPIRSRIDARTVEKLGARKSSCKASTARFQIYRTSGRGRLVAEILFDKPQETSETAYISQTSA